jgi:hypothetical protein
VVTDELRGDYETAACFSEVFSLKEGDLMGNMLHDTHELAIRRALNIDEPQPSPAKPSIHSSSGPCFGGASRLASAGAPAA